MKPQRPPKNIRESSRQEIPGGFLPHREKETRVICRILAQKIAPTNRSYVSDAVMLFRFNDDGQIIENQSWYDSVDWFHQIGVGPNIGAPPQRSATGRIR